MAGRPKERERFYARLSLLLGCALLGMVLGGVASRLPVNLRLRTAPKPVPPVTTPVPSPSRVVTTDALPDLGPALAVPDGGQPLRRELWVLVVDQSGQPASGVSVLARPGLLTASSATGATALGELGVLPGTLPFPEDVIAGQTAAEGRLLRGGSTTSSWVATSDAKGVVHFGAVASGRLLLLANYQGKSASGEVEVPASTTAPSAEAAVRVVLRLASPVECIESVLGEPGDPLLAGTALSARADLKGRIVDHRGFAVTAAKVEVIVAGTRSQATSDARGEFVLPLLPAGEARLTVRATGFAPLQQSVKMEQRRDEQKLELRPGGGLAGQIEDVRTSGLPDGLEVWLELPTGERWPLQVAPDGHFTQTGLPPGPLVLRARARGYAPLRQIVQVPDGSSPDQVTVRDLRLRFARGAQLSGQVRGPSGHVEAADLQVFTDDGQLVSRTRTDRRGEFNLQDLPPGHLRVTVTHPQGTATLGLDLRPSDRQHQDLELH